MKARQRHHRRQSIGQEDRESYHRLSESDWVLGDIHRTSIGATGTTRAHGDVAGHLGSGAATTTDRLSNESR